MTETIHVRGEGGAIFAMDLPLPEGIADRYAAGLLQRVNPDGSPWAHSPRPATTASAPTEGDVPRPAKVANKPEWVAWAIAVHGLEPEDAEAMTKGALAELPDAPVTAAADGKSGQTGHSSRPSEDEPKAAWIAYVVSRGHMSAEDAATFTKDDLIDLVK